MRFILSEFHESCKTQKEAQKIVKKTATIAAMVENFSWERCANDRVHVYNCGL